LLDWCNTTVSVDYADNEDVRKATVRKQPA
jgi:hypothetical protein